MIDSAPRKSAPASGPDRTARGLVIPPTREHGPFLGKAIDGGLSSCAAEVAKKLRDCDEGILSRLAVDSARAWSRENFDPKIAALRGHLERDGDGALRNGLAAAWRWGAYGNDRDRDVVDQKRARLREIEERLSALPEAGDPDKMARENFVEAVTHDAAVQAWAKRVAELTARSDLREPDAPPDLGMEM